MVAYNRLVAAALPLLALIGHLWHERWVRAREERQAWQNLAEATATFKAKVSKTVLKVGGLMPKLPSVSANDSRLLPQNFLGGHLNSQEIAGLTLEIVEEREELILPTHGLHPTTTTLWKAC